MFVDSLPVRRYRPKNIIPPSQWYRPKSNFTCSLNTLFTGSMDILPGIKSVSEIHESFFVCGTVERMDYMIIQAINRHKLVLNDLICERDDGRYLWNFNLIWV